MIMITKMTKTRSSLLLVSLCLPLLFTWTRGMTNLGHIDIGMGQTFADAVAGMVQKEQLTSEQAMTLMLIMGETSRENTEIHMKMRATPVATMSLKEYVTKQVEADAMEEETALSIQAMLGMLNMADDDEDRYNPVKVDKNNAVTVKLEGRYEAPEDFNIYNGVWGYMSPEGKEYALQCNSLGLNIVDITDPKNTFRVDFIPMPGGDVWRDVGVHTDEKSGKSYAYAAGQTAGGETADLWVLDLSYLPNKIPKGNGYKMIEGYTEDGHTLNVAGGFLFLNTAANSRGVKILDVQDDPMNPVYICNYLGGDGHDSFYAEGLKVGPFRRNILISSDGWTERTRFIDITGLRRIYSKIGFFTIGTTSPLIIAESEFEAPSYQHSTAVTEDGNYMYMFDELNQYDIAIYDISNVARPQRLGIFQWSGESPVTNSIVHNGRVKGDLLHVAYYTAGYRVFNISDPVNPKEVGVFESYCEYHKCDKDAFGNYKGAWNVFPDLPSGRILLSDTEGGSFIFSVK